MLKGHVGRKRHRKSPTRATLGKLTRALDELESFYDADDRPQVITYTEAEALLKAIRTIQSVESSVWAREKQ